MFSTAVISDEHWHLEQWGAIRVAGLPVDTLAQMRFEQSLAALSELKTAEASLALLRKTTIDSLHSAIHGCGRQRLRHSMLALKRDIFNARMLSQGLGAEASELPSVVREHLGELMAAEARISDLATAYEMSFAAEMSTAREAMKQLLSDSRLLNGLLLSSQSMWHRVEEFRALSSRSTPSNSQRNLQAALLRYIVRAATRTTPFSSFAGTALVPMTAETVNPPPATAKRSFETGGSAVVWRSVPQLHSALVGNWLSARLTSLVRAKLPLHLTPIRRIEKEPYPAVVFAGKPVPSYEDCTEELADSVVWLSVRLNATIERIIASVDGRTCAELARLLADSDRSSESWLELFDNLVARRFIERRMPNPEVRPRGIRKLANEVARLGDCKGSQKLKSLARLVEQYEKAPPARRAALIGSLNDLAVSSDYRSPLHEDVIVDGLSMADMGINAATLAGDLLPALALARACASEAPHQLMCDAFISRYGVRGHCDDVPAFLVDLLKEGTIASQLRRAGGPIPWLHGRMGNAILTGQAQPLRIPPEWFGDLSGPNAPSALVVFVQLSASSYTALRCGEYQAVVNGIQSGRSKYLSRYLGDDSPAARRALKSIRARLAVDADALPVEIAPTLGSNFQLHPPFTGWTLETPLECGRTERRLLPLTDLTLSFDAKAGELRLYSRHLGCNVEPLHAGFLRDLNLPDPLLLLRALSPRIRDETLAERTAIYNALDSFDVSRGIPLRPFRPQIEVGRLVLERARWAVALADVPRRLRMESDPAFYRRLLEWRLHLGLPTCSFVRRLAAAQQSTSTSSPLYIDWRSPPMLDFLRRFLPPPNQDDQTNTWLLFSEALPTPETALLTVNGSRHVAEIMIQFEWRPLRE